MLFLAGCGASLFGVGPVRTLEEWLAPAVVPLDLPLAKLLPSADGGDGQSAARADYLAVLGKPAAEAFAAWGRDLLGSPAAASPGRQALLVPVLASRPDRHELVVALPPTGARLGAAVAHRGVLLGFLSEINAAASWGRASSLGGAASGGAERRGVVALLGHRSARTVAAEWRPDPEARAVQVLLSPGGRTQGFALRAEGASSSVPPPPGQLVWTRDVSALGDRLPAGLYLGRLHALERERPGGAPQRGPVELRVLPIVDPHTVDHVSLEVEDGSALPVRGVSASLIATSGSQHRARVDVGSRQGVRVGDFVAQDGLYLGRIVVVAPTSAVLDRALPPSPLLVMSPQGDLVSCRDEPSSWPAGWTPLRGDLVATGHLTLGGLILGTIREPDSSRLLVTRPEPDPRRPVLVAGAP
ncbi:MAG: hypothetical protein ACT4PU_09965 [Planctomycetota bacterium]